MNNLPIALIDCGSNKFPQIEFAVEATGFIFKSYKIFEEVNPDDYSKMIISGAPILPTEIDSSRHLQYFEKIIDWNKNILGICFGHQMIGMLHGAKIFKGKEYRKALEISILKEANLFKGFDKNLTVMEEDHCEEIELPSDFELIATSKMCEVEGMKHKMKHIYGVQFHPEVSAEDGWRLISNFCNLTE